MHLLIICGAMDKSWDRRGEICGIMEAYLRPADRCFDQAMLANGFASRLVDGAVSARRAGWLRGRWKWRFVNAYRVSRNIYD